MPELLPLEELEDDDDELDDDDALLDDALDPLDDVALLSMDPDPDPLVDEDALVLDAPLELDTPLTLASQPAQSTQMIANRRMRAPVGSQPAALSVYNREGFARAQRSPAIARKCAAGPRATSPRCRNRRWRICR